MIFYFPETCSGETFSGWNEENGFSETSNTTNGEVDMATQYFYCNIGYVLKPSGVTEAHCRNDSQPQWDIEGTSVSCVESKW